MILYLEIILNFGKSSFITFVLILHDALGYIRETSPAFCIRAASLRLVYRKVYIHIFKYKCVVIFHCSLEVGIMLNFHALRLPTWIGITISIRLVGLHSLFLWWKAGIKLKRRKTQDTIVYKSIAGNRLYTWEVAIDNRRNLPLICSLYTFIYVLPRVYLWHDPWNFILFTWFIRGCLSSRV